VERINDNDISVRVPDNAPDPVNTVIVVECKEEIEAGENRLIDVNLNVNTFHVFDGNLQGETLRYGRGHDYDDYVLGWTNAEDYVSWNLRLNEKAEFDLLISYKAIPKSAGGVCKVSIGGYSFTSTVEEGTIDDLNLGTVSLDPGLYQLEARAESLNVELMKLRNIKLTTNN